MKYLILLFSLASSFSSFSQGQPGGAWQLNTNNHHFVLLFMDGYFTATDYTDQEFISSWGGPYSIDGNTIQVKKEFDTRDMKQTGTAYIMNFSVKDHQLILSANDREQETYTRLDNGKASLAGVWKITGREQDGKLTEIHQTGPRKTLKMLTGKRFQWFAINPETKQFSGTGGGTYNFENGKYTENILFFSRDNSRVGASLQFDGKIVDGNWHHSGLSSKGDKIYEIWGKAGQ